MNSVQGTKPTSTYIYVGVNQTSIIKHGFKSETGLGQLSFSYPYTSVFETALFPSHGNASD